MSNEMAAMEVKQIQRHHLEITHTNLLQCPVKGGQPHRPNQTLTLFISHLVIINISLHIQIDHFFTPVKVLCYMFISRRIELKRWNEETSDASGGVFLKALCDNMYITYHVLTVLFLVNQRYENWRNVSFELKHAFGKGSGSLHNSTFV